MNDFMTLLGAQDVADAGRAISRAAHEMRQAAASMEESVTRLQRLLQEPTWHRRCQRCDGSGEEYGHHCGACNGKGY